MSVLNFLHVLPCFSAFVGVAVPMGHRGSGFCLVSVLTGTAFGDGRVWNATVHGTCSIWGRGS